MSFSATRLTCFALLSAMEDDMRASIEAFLGDRLIADVLAPTKAELCQSRRNKDGLGAAGGLAGLLPYLDFGDGYEVLASHKEELDDPLQADLKLIAPQLARTIAIRNRVAHTRPMEIDDSAHLLDLCAGVLAAGAAHWATLSETMERLSGDPSYVLGLTINLLADAPTGPQHNLPIPDFDETGFFGRQDQLRRIKKAIKGAYPVVSVLGDGGIGKTSIALKAAYDLLEDDNQSFEAFVWVTAKATILTTSEIQRISGAIEESLGLFANAAGELAGAAVDVDDPVAEVLAYMESFRVLLILDNLETVLDARLREFLLDLPLGSKVLITSRIGLGIENPVQLEPLSVDDGTRLLRALARVRDVGQLKALPQATLERLTEQMGGHPAFIRWFVAGVQAGKRPEELVYNNELLLDFCMSNVFDHLSEDARSVVRVMQVLPGSRNQAELAFISEFPAARIQTSLLELLTTNFVQMSTRSSGETVDTVYVLSEFGRQYLDKHHSVSQDERAWLLAKSAELRDLGLQLAAVSTTSPYSPDTVNVRGVGDVHVARLLREAIRRSPRDTNGALRECTEAQVLAPSYYESWRVEARIRAEMQDHAGAIAAFDRALELAPDSPVLYFHFGQFLLNEAGEPHRALEILQAGARLDPDSAQLAGQISWAHFCLGDHAAAIDACRHVLGLPTCSQADSRAAATVALRAAAHGIREHLDRQAYDTAAELIELALEFSESVQIELIQDEPLDRLAQLQAMAGELADGAVDYVARKAATCQAQLRERQRQADAGVERRAGVLKTLKSDKGFGFVSAGDADYFLHFRDLLDVRDWDALTEGVPCVFEPKRTDRGLRAERIRVLA
jgi:LuxR family glucitol operon transcriptional activator